MNLTELRKEIRKCQKAIKDNRFVYFNEGKLSGIKQTVETVDNFMFLSREPDYDNFGEWQKIKELLNLTDIQKGEELRRR